MLTLAPAHLSLSLALSLFLLCSFVPMLSSRHGARRQTQKFFTSHSHHEYQFAYARKQISAEVIDDVVVLLHERELESERARHRGELVLNSIACPLELLRTTPSSVARAPTRQPF